MKKYGVLILALMSGNIIGKCCNIPQPCPRRPRRSAAPRPSCVIPTICLADGQDIDQDNLVFQEPGPLVPPQASLNNRRAANTLRNNTTNTLSENVVRTVTASNVVIDLRERTLDVPSNTTWYEVIGANNVTVLGGVIRTDPDADDPQNTRAFLVNGVDRLIFQGTRFENLDQGVVAIAAAVVQEEDSDQLGLQATAAQVQNFDIEFRNCEFVNVGEAISAEATDGLIVDECSFLVDPSIPGTSNIGILANCVKNISATRNFFSNQSDAAIRIQSSIPEVGPPFPSENVIIDKNNFNGGGQHIDLISTSNVQVTHCNFSQSSSATNTISMKRLVEDVLLNEKQEEVFTVSEEQMIGPHARGLLIDSCTFISLPSMMTAEAADGEVNTHLFLGGTQFGEGMQDAIVRNSTFTPRSTPPLLYNIV